MNNESNRFDLEHEIMNCWRVVDDLKMYYDHSDEMTEDQKMNMMLGIITIYELRFDKMFKTFEECIRKKEFDVVPK